MGKTLNQEKENRTVLGYRDITTDLMNDTLNYIEKNDVIRSILVEREKKELHYGEPVKIYHFYSREYRVRWRIFPLDEIIHEGERCDIIVQNWKNTPGISNLDVQIYHDLEKGERMKVRISRRDEGADPSFKLFNHIAGFVKRWRYFNLYEQLKVGSEVLVEVSTIWEKGTLLHVATTPIKLLRG